MKTGDLLKFDTGFIGTIIETSESFGGYAVVLISGDIKFKNPTHMSWQSLEKCAEVISESR
jgi:hypothetical protein